MKIILLAIFARAVSLAEAEAGGTAAQDPEGCPRPDHVSHGA